MPWRITLGDKSALLGDLPVEIFAKASDASTRLGWRGILYFPKSDPVGFKALIVEVATYWEMGVPDIGKSADEVDKFMDEVLEEIEDDLPKTSTETDSPPTGETKTGTSPTSISPEDGDQKKPVPRSNAT